jgi:hypothetical protein
MIVMMRDRRDAIVLDCALCDGGVSLLLRSVGAAMTGVGQRVAMVDFSG